MNGEIVSSSVKKEKDEDNRLNVFLQKIGTMFSGENEKNKRTVLSIRDLEINDLEALIKIEKKAYPTDLSGIDSFLAYREYLEKYEGKDVPKSFVLEKNGKLVAYLILTIQESNLNNNENVIFIEDMVVLPQHQGLGIAHKIMKRIFKILKEYEGKIEKFNGSVEAEARSKTSFAMLNSKGVKFWLNKNAYQLEVISQDNDFYGSGETFFSIRLEKKKHDA